LLHLGQLNPDREIGTGCSALSASWRMSPLPFMTARFLNLLWRLLTSHQFFLIGETSPEPVPGIGIRASSFLQSLLNLLNKHTPFQAFGRHKKNRINSPD